jgi:DNA-binding MarR family transcriptional regulator/GNAT superfamily N-acetyltransferase
MLNPVPVSADLDLADRVAAVRHFNRVDTARIGVLHAGYADSPFSLTEARVLYEIRERDRPTASDIGRDLDLDAGYLSRILRRFQKLGFIRKETSPTDARQSLLSLTPRGRKAFAPVEARSARHVGAMLDALTTAQQDDLVAALHTAETLLAGKPQQSSMGAQSRQPILRQPRAGDFGWIVERHGVLYGQEYGWGENFEGVCAQIVADFVNTFDPRCERGWIAELDGRNVGCVLLVKDKPGVARLRLLLVEPSARGLGIGTRLTDECIRFARERGYRKMTLWTHSVLTAARAIYARAGFTLTSSEPKQSFGRDVVSEHWDLTL